MLANPVKLSVLFVLVLICSSPALGQTHSGAGIGPGNLAPGTEPARILSKPEPQLPKDAPKETVKIFKRHAIDAAKQIKFVPAMKDGRQVSMFVQLEYNFDPLAEKKEPATKAPDTESPSNGKKQKPKV